MEQVLFAWSNGVLALLTLRRVRVHLPGADAWCGLLAWAVALPVAANAVLLAAWASGSLTSSRVAALLAVLLIVDLGLSGHTRRPQPPPPDAAPGFRVEDIAIVVLGAAAFPFLLKAVLGGNAFVWDDLSYHAALPAFWLQHATISVPGFGYQSYYGHNAELFTLWFSLPLGLDVHAGVVVLFWVMVAATGFVVISQASGAGRNPGLLAAAAFLISTPVLGSSGTFSAHDLAAAAFGLAGLAFAVVGTGRPGRGWATWCGLAAGFAAGTRVTMVSALLPIAGWWGLRELRDRRAASRWLDLACFSAAAALAGLFWYGQNLVLSGNPVFPVDMGPLAGPFSAEARWHTSLARQIAIHWRDPGFWSVLLHARMDWPGPLALLSLLGFAGGLITAVRGSAGPGRRAALWLLLGAGCLSALLFPFEPFSGTPNRPDGVLDTENRYLDFPFGVGLALYAALCPRLGLARKLHLLLATAAVLHAAAVAPPTIREMLAAGLGLASLGYVLARVHPRLVRGAPWIAVPALILLLVASTPWKRRFGDASLFHWRQDHPIAAAWQAVDALPPGSRIASFDLDPGSLALYYPLFGRSMQQIPVPIRYEGSPREPLHLSWRRQPPDWWWESSLPGTPVDASALLANLREARVDYVLVSKWPRRRGASARWPAQRQALLDRLPPERRVYTHDYAEIWEVR